MQDLIRFILVKSETYYTNNQKLTIDPFFMNKPLFFQGTSTTETGLSNCHKLLSTFMRSFVSLLKPKNILFRNYKKLLRQSSYLIWKIQISFLHLLIQMKTIYFSRIHFPKYSKNLVPLKRKSREEIMRFLFLSI